MDNTNQKGETIAEALSNHYDEKMTFSLEKLDASNLPELAGWEQKQKDLVKENPYVEITDNSTFESAKKARTNLLKGRTSLVNQDKAIASKLTSFRKQVSDKTKELIDITLPHEEKQQTEVSRYENIKENERIEKERLERERVEKIKNRISEIETEAFTIIQKLTFDSPLDEAVKVKELITSDFDFEEFDILYQQAVSRIEKAYEDKVSDLKEKEQQRKENERLRLENEERRNREELQSKRLNELLPFNGIGADVNMTSLWELSQSDYDKIFSDKKQLFEKKESERIELEKQQQKEAKERQEKIDADAKEAETKKREELEKVMKIRNSRLSEIGFDYIGLKGFVHNEFDLIVSSVEVTKADVIDFENIFNDAKTSIKNAIDKKESDKKAKEIEEKKRKESEAKTKKENTARIKRLASDKKFLAGELEKYFSLSPLEFLTENQETKDFIKSASERIECLKSELLTELNNL